MEPAGIAQATTNTDDSKACYTKMKNNIARADQTQSKIQSLSNTEGDPGF